MPVLATPVGQTPIHNGDRTKRHKTGAAMDAFTTPVRDVVAGTGHTSSGKNRQHIGEKVTQYSIQTRLNVVDDFYHGIDMDTLLTKYNIMSTKSISRWLKEFADGHYDECFQWTVERRTKTFKIGNLGRKVHNPQLEAHLLQFMRELDDAHLQTLSSL